MFFLSLFRVAGGAEDVIVTPSTEALLASYDEALLALANAVQVAPLQAEMVIPDNPVPAQQEVTLPDNPAPAQQEVVLPDNVAPVSWANEMPDNNGTIASATSLDLTQISSSTIDVTGTTTVTSIIIPEGQTRTLRFTGALVLTNGASLVLLGGANVTTVAGDYGVFRGYASGVVRCVSYSLISSSADNLASLIHAATSKTTPVDADELPLSDSAASFSLKKLTWANLKATLATWIGGTLIAGAFTTLKASSGLQVVGTSTPASGSGLELKGTGYAFGYDRGAGAYIDSHWGGFKSAISAAAGDIATVTSAGLSVVGTTSTTTGMAVGGATAGTGGIAFPATAVAVADVNTLDDYEEGTWTPIDSSGAGLSFTSVSGKYTKIGRMVTVFADLTYPATASGASAVIGGLPFTSSANEPGIHGWIRYTSVATATLTFVTGGTSATTVSLLRPGANATNANMTLALLRFGAIYFV
jgi:hypothetical protein